MKSCRGITSSPLASSWLGSWLGSPERHHRNVFLRWNVTTGTSPSGSESLSPGAVVRTIYEGVPPRKKAISRMRRRMQVKSCQAYGLRWEATQ